MTHTWPNAVVGFDSRWWDGRLPSTTYAASLKYYFTKATQGDDFTSAQFPLQWERAERLFGAARGAYAFHKYASNPTSAAVRYHNVVVTNGGYGGFPPILDLEDTRAPADARTPAHAWVQLQEMEQLSGREVLCYTAAWIFSRWAPYVASDQRFYDRLLWEADPEPDTAEPGLWPKSKLAMVQVRLDFNPGGFNAVIDEDHMDPAAFARWVPQDPGDTVTVTMPRAAYEGLRGAVCP